jgi:hypothetical protein
MRSSRVGENFPACWAASSGATFVQAVARRPAAPCRHVDDHPVLRTSLRPEDAEQGARGHPSRDLLLAGLLAGLHPDPPLGASTATSYIFLAAIVALVAFLSITKKDQTPPEKVRAEVQPQPAA